MHRKTMTRLSMSENFKMLKWLRSIKEPAASRQALAVAASDLIGKPITFGMIKRLSDAAGFKVDNIVPARSAKQSSKPSNELDIALRNAVLELGSRLSRIERELGI